MEDKTESNRVQIGVSFSAVITDEFNQWINELTQQQKKIKQEVKVFNDIADRKPLIAVKTLIEKPETTTNKD